MSLSSTTSSSVTDVSLLATSVGRLRAAVSVSCVLFVHWAGDPVGVWSDRGCEKVLHVGWLVAAVHVCLVAFGCVMFCAVHADARLLLLSLCNTEVSWQSLSCTCVTSRYCY